MRGIRTAFLSGRTLTSIPARDERPGKVVEDKDWLIIKRLYELKSITRTAENIHITQPALSLRLKNIEQELGAVLLERSKKGVTFTPQGEIVFAYAKKYLDSIEVLKDSLQYIDQGLFGRIRLGASNFITRYFLPALFKDFKDKYPNVELQVSTGNSDYLFQSLNERKIHVAFMRGNYVWPEERHLLRSEVMCIVNNQPFEISDLPGLPLIHYSANIVNQALIDHWWKERFTAPPMKTMEVDRVDTCLEMVKHGLGWGILPESILTSDPSLHVMKMKFHSGKLLERRSWIFLHHREGKQKLIRFFINSILASNRELLDKDGTGEPPSDEAPAHGRAPGT